MICYMYHVFEITCNLVARIDICIYETCKFANFFYYFCLSHINNGNITNYGNYGHTLYLINLNNLYPQLFNR